jgi:hypothetical protein
MSGGPCTDLNARTRRPFPGEGYLWAFGHRLLGHRPYRAGWSIGWGGYRRSWGCACLNGGSWPR